MPFGMPFGCVLQKRWETQANGNQGCMHPEALPAKPFVAHNPSLFDVRATSSMSVG